MSIINATLVAQAIHFFIAYLLIKYLFFKPVFVQIEQEDTLQASLIATVQAHQQKVAQKEQDLVTQWHSLRNYFSAHVPVIKPLDVPRNQAQVELPDHGSHYMDKAIDRATQEIIKQVNDVR